ncbi:hypothetical protein M9H77_31061 [Catharanthus roseus]|uniref:Uncharacterized protein n=1 Tax=Catharanthus roseus TaxID=4058 RepID=A0ACB9ZZD2_CATRO|nr:hypothetical protein M9H77_31061 [Catharanthus roseus]
MHDNQWGYGNFSSHARSYEHNSYACYKSNRIKARDCYNDISYKAVRRHDVRNRGNYVNIDERIHKRRDDYEGYYDSYNHGGYNYRRSSQTLETTSRPLSCNKLKLPLLCGTYGTYDYEAWKKKMESLFYSYCVKQNDKFQLVLKSLSYELNVRWNSKFENGKIIGIQPIKSWSLMKQSLRNKFGVQNHERQRQGQAKEKFIESSMGEKKNNRKKNKMRLKRSEETKEVLSLKTFEGDKREEMKESCCDISSSLNSLSSEEGIHVVAILWKENGW